MTKSIRKKDSSIINPNKSRNAAGQEIVSICKRLSQSKLIVGIEGNVSYRLSAQEILITPSGVNKGVLSFRDLVSMNTLGKKTKGKGKISSEALLHLRIYEKRTDVRAVIHAHPAHAIALSLAGISLMEPYLAETVICLGKTPTVPYATSGTAELADAIEPYLDAKATLLLERHGAVSFADNLETACNNLEILEKAAQILVLARNLGNPQPLSDAALKKLGAARDD